MISTRTTEVCIRLFLEREVAGEQLRQRDGGWFVDDDACDERNLCLRKHQDDGLLEHGVGKVGDRNEKE